MADLASVSAVSAPSSTLSARLEIRAVLTPRAEDYALMESSYAIIRLLQRYPGIKIPPGVPNEPVGMERQHLGIVLTSAEGAQVCLD